MTNIWEMSQAQVNTQTCPSPPALSQVFYPSPQRLSALQTSSVPDPSNNGKEPGTDKNQQHKPKGKPLGHFSERLGKVFPRWTKSYL